MTAKLDIPIGKKFGRYTVLQEIRQTGKRRHMLCRCDCGTEKVISIDKLKRGTTKSCGCLKKEKISILNKTHGYSKTNIHNLWIKMRIRCSPKASELEKKTYFGKGIRVCERWQVFENFLQDMGERPPGLQIDRIDNNGDYEPSNCRWATRKTNCRNTSCNRILTFNGESKPVSEWAEAMGVLPTILFTRLFNGWTVERTLTQPLRPAYRNKTIGGQQ